MSNRIIKDSIWRSPNLNKLSDEAECHFYRVLLSADDYGRFEATPEIVKGLCYPLKSKMTTKDIEKRFAELEKNHVLRFWKDESGRTWGEFVNFDRHNSKYSVTEDGKPTRHRPKTPTPPDKFLPVFANLCQSLPNPNPNPNPNHNTTVSLKSENTATNLPKEKKPYKHPETPLAKTICAWKMLQGYSLEDRAWDAANWSRTAKTCKLLLDFFSGSNKMAVTCMREIKKSMESKGLTCTIETVLKHSAEWNIKNGGLVNVE